MRLLEKVKLHVANTIFLLDIATEQMAQPTHDKHVA